MQIGKRFSFEAAHRLQDHDGKCRNLHGHSYQLEVSVSGSDELRTEGPQRGMLLDFGVISSWWKSIEPDWDHRVILERTDPLMPLLANADQALNVTGWPPTAEHLALHFKALLATWLYGHGYGAFLIVSISVWETETSWATV